MGRCILFQFFGITVAYPSIHGFHFSINIFAADKPSPPRNFRVTAFDKEFVDLKWEVPENNDGEPITGYLVERRGFTKTAFVLQGKTDAKTLNLKATGLIEGTQYMFRVFAINSIGQSEPAELKEPVTAEVPFDPPGPPVKLRAEEVTKASAMIRFEPPEQDGGPPVTGYYVEKEEDGKWTRVNRKAITVRELLLDDLGENSKYTVRVMAENDAGVGKPCAEIIFVATNELDVPGKPGQPEVVNITEASAELTWAAPKSDGGTHITNYVIERKKRGNAKWKVANVDEKVTETKYEVKGLQSGTEYEFRVTADNKIGPGPPSNPSKMVKYGELVLLI